MKYKKGFIFCFDGEKYLVSKYIGQLSPNNDKRQFLAIASGSGEEYMFTIELSHPESPIRDPYPFKEMVIRALIGFGEFP